MKRNLFFIFLSALLLLTACSEKGEQNTSAIKYNKEEEQRSTQEISKGLSYHWRCERTRTFFRD